MRSSIACLIAVAACGGGTPKPASRTTADQRPAEARPAEDTELVYGGEVDRDGSSPGADLDRQTEEARRGGGEASGEGSGDAEPEAPRGRIDVDAKALDDDTSLTLEAVLSKIQSVYFPGLQLCYKDTLKVDPAVEGKARVELEVDEDGRTREVKVDGPTAQLAACVEDKMASWTFPVPKDADGEATTAAFIVTLDFALD